jgi:hypothetical protein
MNKACLHHAQKKTRDDVYEFITSVQRRVFTHPGDNGRSKRYYIRQPDRTYIVTDWGYGIMSLGGRDDS